jgi:NitT/TauT family transport system substrate-binding protein
MLMCIEHTARWSRREFLAGLGLASTAGLLGVRPELAAAEPPPETTQLRLIKIPSTCVAPQFISEELLLAEGFTEVQYLQKAGAPPARLMASGEFDITASFLPLQIPLIDRGAPVLILAGSHVGCTELFAAPHIRSLRDLKGKTIAVFSKDPLAADRAFAAMFVASVGLRPDRDLHFVVHPWGEAGRLLAQGQIDAFVAGPPETLEFRAQKIGHVLVTNTVDRPWSQYFCCMVAGHREFVRRQPVATKRALRAILKATQVCALEPERVARFMVDKGYTTPDKYDYALESLKELPYGQWREYDAEDAVRFYALRLHELGMIKHTPQQIIAQGTDWRFLNELKKELKG